jgi:hypothetical protein
MRKRRGESGQPCRNPHEERKVGEGEPFIKREKEGFSTQDKIQLTVSKFMPIWIRLSLIKVQFTLS